MEHVVINYDVPLYSAIPFVLMLMSIAILPIVAHHFWENNLNKLLISLVLGIPTAIWMIAVGLTDPLYHELVFEYVPFIVLLGGLFVITGGIFVDGNIEAKPTNNAIILFIGAFLASFMGTTGAAMLLIRPLLHTIKRRQYKKHIVLFFIAIVANCGGLMTPLGDPPLFMMYLRGAPFEWFLKLAPEWLIINSFCVIVFYLVDRHYWNKESEEVKRAEREFRKPIKTQGNLNFIFLVGVILSVAFINKNVFPGIGANPYYGFAREGVIILMAFLSLKLTPHIVRVSNSFTWEPIQEVAYLFLGIFITMVPCILYLEVHAKDLGIDNPVVVYYATGILSSFLDNTPTAVTFHSLAEGLFHSNPELFVGEPIVARIPEVLLRAICLSSVMFGAMTYIGNGPNFMVKAIAESHNIKMPHFFEYMIKFSIIVLLPIFIIIQLIFV